MFKKIRDVQNKTLMRWILVGCVVLMIPLISAVINFFVNKNLIEKKIEQVNEFMLKNIQFEITVETETDAAVRIIPPAGFKRLMEESAPMANYVNQLMAGRFSEVVWLMEQIMWKSFDSRLAAFLLEECMLEETEVLKITHEKIADHLGTAREVVTRMLRYFQGEGMVRLSRGTVEILDEKKLGQLAK